MSTLALAVLAGCTSGSSGKQSPGTSSVTTSSSAAASVSASAATSASQTPTSSPTPVSPFEQDPAVQGMRAFFYQAGRAVNTGHAIDSQFRATMTSFVAKQINQVTGPDVGKYYPGPVPYTPLGVRIVNSTKKVISGCIEAGGWAQNPKTHKPADALKITGAEVVMAKESGKWLVDGLPFTKSISCSGVTVKGQKW